MNLIELLPILIIVLPMSAALLSPFVSMLMRRAGRWIVILGLAGALASSIGLLRQVMYTAGHSIHYAVGNWKAPLGIEFVIDPLNALLVCFITFLALCAVLYSGHFSQAGHWLLGGGYFTLMSLLCVGLCGMTLTGDVFNLYVFLEIASLSCYGLVALGSSKRSVLAAFRYLLIGTIGASFYLMAIGILYSMTGSLNMADISVLIQPQMDSPLIILACVCLVAAFGIKMALFPFHSWQPDAYSYSHPGASPLISGVMSKVPALAMFRFFFFIFGVQNWIIADTVQIIGILGAIGMVYGSVMALSQTDFRRMLAYSSVAQLGYVALGLGIGNVYGLTGSFLHILNHIFMKGGLFFAIGGIQYRFGIVEINKFGQLYKKMPYTCFTIVMGSLAMVGIPPTGGFFSKWYLMLGALESGDYIYIGVLVLSSLLNAIYFLRVIEKIFIAPAPNELKEYGAHPEHLPLPVSMLVPIILFGIGIVAMGFANGILVDTVIRPVFEGVLL